MPRRLLLPLIALALLASCGTDTSGDANVTIAPTTLANGDIKISSTPTDQWGPTSTCPIPAGNNVQGTAATEGIEGVQAFPTQSQDHKDGCLTYANYPPIGGAHNQAWATCGFYSSPVPLVNAVHSMEHGGVWVTFSPDISQAELKVIIAATGSSPFVLASPYPNLGAPIVLSAWTRQLRLDSTSDPRFAKFISTYVQGPQTPELGPPCKQGFGTPG